MFARKNRSSKCFRLMNFQKFSEIFWKFFQGTLFQSPKKNLIKLAGISSKYSLLECFCSRDETKRIYLPFFCTVAIFKSSEMLIFMIHFQKCSSRYLISNIFDSVACKVNTLIQAQKKGIRKQKLFFFSSFFLRHPVYYYTHLRSDEVITKKNCP